MYGSAHLSGPGETQHATRNTQHPGRNFHPIPLLLNALAVVAIGRFAEATLEAGVIEIETAVRSERHGRWLAKRGEARRAVVASVAAKLLFRCNAGNGADDAVRSDAANAMVDKPIQKPRAV